MNKIRFLAVVAVVGFAGLAGAQAQHHGGGGHGHPGRYYDRGPYHGHRGGGVYFGINLAPEPIYVAPAPVYVERRNVVADVQVELNRRGYRAGGVDGVMGPQTADAIARYQRDHDLRVTGGVNEALVRSLRL